jgi:uncharacterized protein YjaZ
MNLFEAFTMLERYGGKVEIELYPDENNQKIMYKRMVRCGDTAWGSKGELTNDSFNNFKDEIEGDIKLMVETKIDDEYKNNVVKELEEVIEHIKNNDVKITHFGRPLVLHREKCSIQLEFRNE